MGNSAGRLFNRIDTGLRGIGAACLFAIMLIVFLDVGARYLLNSPIAWSYELIGMYLMPATFYFAVSDTLAHKEHIAIDMLRPRLPAGLLRFTDTVGLGAAAAIFLFIASIYVESAADKFRSDSVMIGVIEWPTWIPDTIVVGGAVMVALRLFAHALIRLSGHEVRIPGRADSEQAAAFEGDL